MRVLKASSSMTNGSTVVNGYEDGQPSTNNFYIGVRNIRIDTTAVLMDQEIYSLSWAVSQATSLINVHLRVPEGSEHVGIEMDGGESGGGSGLFMGDLTFTGRWLGFCSVTKITELGTSGESFPRVCWVTVDGQFY
jgi:glucan 1,3-beta-glucosidase